MGCKKKYLWLTNLLMERAQQFQQLIDEYNGILYKIGRSYTRDEEDFKELYQEMLVQLWSAYGRFRGDAKVSTWLYRVALNTAITYQKKKKRLKVQELEPKAYRLADTSAAQLALEQQRASQVELLYHCIYQLKKDDRAIILLHLEEKSYQEMADILGITVNHVGVKINRARKRLFRLLQAEGYERI
ncbi:MAG: sigma-70 family RNA polymerase sigma factor [Bacteroidota bacterium]